MEPGANARSRQHAGAISALSRANVALRCAKLDALALLARCRRCHEIGPHLIVSLAKLRVCGPIAWQQKPELVAGRSRTGGCSSSGNMAGVRKHRPFTWRPPMAEGAVPPTPRFDDVVQGIVAVRAPPRFPADRADKFHGCHRDPCRGSFPRARRWTPSIRTRMSSFITPPPLRPSLRRSG
jgi:hypothetical protein